MDPKQLIEELKIISKGFFDKKDYYNAGRINHAIFAIEDNLLEEINAMLTNPEAVKLCEYWGKIGIDGKNPLAFESKQTLKEILKQQLIVEDEGKPDLDMHNLNVVWPSTLFSTGKEDIKDAEGEFEDQCIELENYQILEVTDKNFKLFCGGDWQVPKVIDIQLVEGKPTVVSSKFVDEYQSGIGHEKTIELLNTTSEGSETITDHLNNNGTQSETDRLH